MTQQSSTDNPKFTALNDWLTYLETINPKGIELGLERVKAVFERLQLNFKSSKVVLIGGTNGKGTSCHLLQQILTEHGYRVGCYNSPHIHDYRERVTLDGKWLSEAEHCQIFSQIEDVRGDIALTYFEFSALAAIAMLAKAKPHYILLEVGLGGRLDATNIVEPNLSVITTIDLDHKEWLGDTRALIAKEKAGILRQNGLAVCGDFDPPLTLQTIADDLNAPILYQNKDFSYKTDQNVWHWQGKYADFHNLPKPNMPLQNASTVLAALDLLDVPLKQDLLQLCFERFQLAGRWQQIKQTPNVFIDVAHNPESVAYLKQNIAKLPPEHKKIAVVGMLKDKDILASLTPLKMVFDTWFVATINQPRGASSADLKTILTDKLNIDATQVKCFDSVKQAYQAAYIQADKQTEIIAFGSFWVVTDMTTKGQ